MTSFQAKEKETALTEPGKPGTKTPEGAFEFLRPLGANEAWPRKWEYRHQKHTTQDIVRPGYYTGETRAILRLGDEIHFTVCGGSKVPSEWERGILVVEETPNAKERPLIVAILHRYKKATPVRHDGKMEKAA